MNGMTWIRLVLPVAFAALFGACLSIGAPVGQAPSPLALPQAESPLAVAAESGDCVGVAGIDGFQMVRRTEIGLAQADGSIHPNVIEYLDLVTRTDGRYCNSHMVMGMFDPQTGERDAFNETYAVDDLVFDYCT